MTQIMMATNRQGGGEPYDDHPSLSASLEDFEHSPRSPLFGLPSQHSGFRSEESDSEDGPASEVSGEPWSPPAWRQKNAAGGWYQHQPYPQDNNLLRASASASRSRGTSPIYDSAQEEEGDTTLAAKIPLPRGSMSPVKERSPTRSLEKDPVPPDPPSHPQGAQDAASDAGDTEDASIVPLNSNNCVLPNPRYLNTIADLPKTFVSRCAQRFNNVPSRSKQPCIGYEHTSITCRNRGARSPPPSRSSFLPTHCFACLHKRLFNNQSQI